VNGKATTDRLGDEDFLLLDEERLRASAVFKPDDEQQVVMNGGIVFGTLHVHVNAKEARISEAEYRALLARYLEAVRKRFQESLDTVTKREFEKHLKREAESVAQDRQLANSAQGRVQQKREELRKTAAGLPQSVLEESVSNLQKQEQALALDIEGLKGRSTAIEKQLRDAADELKKAGPDDEVVKHLERVLVARMEQLKRMREAHAGGAIPAAELAKAEENVALAQVEVVQAKRQVGKGPLARIDALNTELARIFVERTEFEAKATYVEEHLASARQALENEMNSAQPLREEIAAEAAAAQAMAIEARKREAELRRLEASYRPASVEVFDLKPADDGASDKAKSDGEAQKAESKKAQQ
jgi:hypothetical protein